jgi:hypothetical protein
VSCPLNRSTLGVHKTMMPKNPEDPIRNYQRNSIAARRKAGQSCKCGETRPQALITICAECLRKQTGKSVFDAHHPAGGANHPSTLKIPSNDHRSDLSDAQYDWPKDTWKNPQGSPLLAGAACIRGYCDTNTYLTNTLLFWVARLLEALDKCLRERLGPDWWVGTPLEQFAPKRPSRESSKRPPR